MLVGSLVVRRPLIYCHVQKIYFRCLVREGLFYRQGVIDKEARLRSRLNPSLRPNLKTQKWEIGVWKARPPHPVRGGAKEGWQELQGEFPSKTLSFLKLKVILDQYIFNFGSTGIMMHTHTSHIGAPLWVELQAGNDLSIEGRFPDGCSDCSGQAEWRGASMISKIETVCRHCSDRRQSCLRRS